MNYRRLLLLTEIGESIDAAVALIRRVSPDADLLVVIARIPLRHFARLADETPDELNEGVAEALARLRDATAGAARKVDVHLTPDLDADHLADASADAGIELVVAASLPFTGLSVLAELRRRRPLPVLLAASAPRSDGAITEVACVALSSNTRAAVTTFLRDHGSPQVHATVFLREPRFPGDIEATLDVAGIEAPVELVTLRSTGRWWNSKSAQGHRVDLVVLSGLAGARVVEAAMAAPVLVLPPWSRPASGLRRAIDAPDLVDEGGVIRARLEYAIGVGRRNPIPDQQVALVSGGRVIAVVTTHAGEAELPPGLSEDALGFFRVAEGVDPDPSAAIEAQVTIIRPASRPLLLFDAALPDEELSALAGLSGPDAPDLLGVRLRPTSSFTAIRERLQAAGVPARVVDASTTLDEGAALDVPEAVDAVRLARVAARMRGAAFPVAAIVYVGPHRPRTIGFAALRAEQVASTAVTYQTPAPRPPSLARRLDATTGAAPLAGNQIEVELDNAMARRWLLDAIDGSRQQLHLQTYMAADDDVGAQIEAALAKAGARGVTVRVLVDSLHGKHGSLGIRNPLLDRLSAHPGVEVRVSRPVTGAPSLEDLKQRDHRKVTIADGALGLVGGRNVSHEYYTGFDEVGLTPESTWREVPWLDAGARVQGPAVAALERSFHDAWVEAGGAPFDITECAPAGSAGARVVVHRGLRDASTLEAYLALIDSARSHVYAVNGFPLILEIQHALLRAIGRGVRVCTLFGNLTPRHGGVSFKGPWANARTAATGLVHSRMDALVAAGGEAYQFAVHEQPSWSPGLGVVQPHVHAKVLSVDGLVCSVGSANLDITAGYWESELVLLVEDETITGGLEAHIERLLAGSARVERDDPEWRRMARDRRWMQRWPGVLSI